MEITNTVAELKTLVVELKTLVVDQGTSVVDQGSQLLGLTKKFLSRKPNLIAIGSITRSYLSSK